MKEKEPNKITSTEKNLKKIKIEESQIFIGEGQSVLISDSVVSFLGKTDQQDIDVFKAIENDKDYNVTSGGYLSCAEITGDIGSGGKFFIHAIDQLNLQKHILKIQEITKNAPTLNVVLRLDDDRADRSEFKVTLQKLLGGELEIENKSFLDV